MLKERGALGFNCKIMIEMAEEMGSIGLRELCERYRADLLKADVPAEWQAVRANEAAAEIA